MHNIIKDLRNTSGTKAKIEYIKDLDTVQKEELKQVLLAAMTPNVSYNFEVIPEYVAKEELYSLQDSLEKIKPLQQSIDESGGKAFVEIISGNGLFRHVTRNKKSVEKGLPLSHNKKTSVRGTMIHWSIPLPNHEDAS